MKHELPPESLSAEEGEIPTAQPTPAILLEFCNREVHSQRLWGPVAEDVVQDALVAFLLQNNSIRNPLAYLKVVIRRKVALARRYAWLVCQHDSVPPPTLKSRVDPWAETDLRIDSRRSLRALGREDRRLAVMVWEGQSFAEIGAELGCSSGAARARTFRMRRKLGADA
jgi:DNA-directed RNA polymerase specialized sigma24 family protein